MSYIATRHGHGIAISLVAAARDNRNSVLPGRHINAVATIRVSGIRIGASAARQGYLHAVNRVTIQRDRTAYGVGYSSNRLQGDRYGGRATYRKATRRIRPANRHGINPIVGIGDRNGIVSGGYIDSVGARGSSGAILGGAVIQGHSRPVDSGAFIIRHRDGHSVGGNRVLVVKVCATSRNRSIVVGTGISRHHGASRITHSQGVGLSIDLAANRQRVFGGGASASKVVYPTGIFHRDRTAHDSIAVHFQVTPHGEGALVGQAAAIPRQAGQRQSCVLRHDHRRAALHGDVEWHAGAAIHRQQGNY